MKSQGGISYSNAAVAACPKHLLQFAVDQRYDDYTPVDHAVWRFIMRQNIFFLREYAHKVYFQGLLNTGISFDRIPRIQEMNDILSKIEWGAVAVDGFIPPAAFMEFQAYKVLSIANTRSIYSALVKSAQKRCRPRKTSSCIKRSGTYRF
jgi:phenylalanine-4-hydroxylase